MLHLSLATAVFLPMLGLDVREHPGGKVLPHDKYVRTVSEADSPIQKLEIPSKDGTIVPAALRKPKGDGPFPVLIHFHGAPGGRGIDKLVEWSSGSTGGPMVGAVPQGRLRRGRRRLPQPRKEAAQHPHPGGRGLLHRRRHRCGRAHQETAVRRSREGHGLRRQPGREPHAPPHRPDEGPLGDPRGARAHGLPRREGSAPRQTDGDRPEVDPVRRDARRGEHQADRVPGP